MSPESQHLRAVTFDIGNTLLTSSATRRAGRGALVTWLGVREITGMEVVQPLIAAADEAWVYALDAGTDAPETAATDLLAATVPGPVSGRDRSELHAIVADRHREPRHAVAEGALDALAALAEEGLRLGIVSNTGPAGPGWLMRRALRHCGLAGFFTPAAMAFSDEVGARKPEPGIFARALAVLDTPPERALHVGNKRDKDVLGARRLGMATVRYAGIRDDAGEGPDADAVIRCYDELVDVVLARA